MSNEIRFYINYWLDVLMIGIFIIPVQLVSANHHLHTTTSTKSTSACAPADARCVVLNIKCRAGSRIQIVSAYYGYRSNFAIQTRNPSNCRDPCMYNRQCCSFIPGDERKNISTDDLHILKNDCSWMEECKPRAPYDDLNQNLYTTVFYDCFPDEMYICEKSEGIINCLNGQNLDIVYAYYGRSDLDVCPHDPVTSTTNTDCNSTEDILSIVKKKCQSQSNRMTCAITPTNDLFKGDPCYGTFKYLTVGYICSKPDAQDPSSTISTVDISSRITLTSTTEKDTTPVPTSAPSSTLTSISDNSSTSVDNPKALGSEESKSSNLPLPAIIAPIVGIIFALGVVGFFFWRKRYKSHTSSQKKANQNLQREMAVCNTSYDDSQQMYDSLKNSFKEPDNTYLSISKDTDNLNATAEEKILNKSNNENNMYSTLKGQTTELYKGNLDYDCLENSSKEPDNIYLSITKDGVKHTDHFNATAEETTLNKSNNESNMYSALEGRETAIYKSLSDYDGVKNDVSIQSKQSDPEQENSYFILEPNIPNAESPVHTKCSDAKNPTLQETEANDYFVLEPETDNSALTTDSGLVRPTPDEISKDNNVTNEYFILEPNLQETLPNDYFVLEPEIDNSAVATDSELVRPNPDEISEENCVKYQANNNLTNDYFTLEPQDNYSCIDPHDVNIQTLPDNEYNILHEIKTEGPDSVSRFNAGKKTEGTDDYSHITNTAFAGNDVIDYSHVKFNKEPQKQEYNIVESQYSHLNL